MQIKRREWRKLSRIIYLRFAIQTYILDKYNIIPDKEPQCCILYNIKSYCFLLFKFKIKLIVSCTEYFHFLFLFNPEIHLFSFIFCHPFSVHLNVLHIPSHKCSICFYYPHRFPFHNSSEPL